MIDSIWFWLYLCVGAALATLNVAVLLSSNTRIPKGRELEGGAILVLTLLCVLCFWPIMITLNLIGHIFSAPTR